MKNFFKKKSQLNTQIRKPEVDLIVKIIDQENSRKINMKTFQEFLDNCSEIYDIIIKYMNSNKKLAIQYKNYLAYYI